jgi:hypothetical protein
VSLKFLKIIKPRNYHIFNSDPTISYRPCKGNLLGADVPELVTDLSSINNGLKK